MRLQILVMLIALVASPMVTRPASAEDKTGGVSSRLAGSYRIGAERLDLRPS